ncbi:hypothetical protein F5Y03DRAFT_9970 [Xylaria venustula]|nr:hypothetical protein F5Y03DRAFT_9970 [Xylaria venustula]
MILQHLIPIVRSLLVPIVLVCAIKIQQSYSRYALQCTTWHYVVSNSCGASCAVGIMWNECTYLLLVGIRMVSPIRTVLSANLMWMEWRTALGREVGHTYSTGDR